MVFTNLNHAQIILDLFAWFIYIDFSNMAEIVNRRFIMSNKNEVHNEMEAVGLAAMGGGTALAFWAAIVLL